MWNYGFLDTHVDYRGRQGREIRLISDLMGKLGINYGFGVCENSALAVKDGVG